MSMSWDLKHSVIAHADRRAVWEFVTDVDNLARVEGDALESITIDGPYQSGTRGTTKMRGQEPTHWRLVDVIPPERATTEVELNEATVRFMWLYEELPDRRTRMTQHIELSGPGAEAYVPVMEQHFAPNLAKGMERLAGEIATFAAGR
jgi:hypothetical protein